MKLAIIILSIALPVVSFLTLAIGYGLGLQRGYREGRVDDPERAEKRGKLRSV